MSPKRLLLGALLALPLAPALAPDLAAASDVVLYEVTETMRLSKSNQSATSALMGRAEVGTPICPQALVKQIAPRATSCSIVVSGADTINRSKGTGNLNATFNVVVELDNAVDGPELVVAAGSFKGTKNLPPALLDGVPYGPLTGSLKLDPAGTQYPFNGVYRLPFLGTDQPYGSWGPTMRQIYCPATPDAVPNAIGSDLVWLDTTDGLPNGRCLPITASELALGTPVVRLDLSFVAPAAARKK